MTIDKKGSTIDIPPPPIPEAAKARADAQLMLSVAQAFAIDCEEAYLSAGEELRAIKKKYNEIEAVRVDLKKPVLEAGKKIDEMFRPALDTLRAAEAACKKEMMRWQTEQDRIRREREAEQARELARAEAARQKALERGDDKGVARAEERAAQAVAQGTLVAPPAEVKGFYTVEKWKAEVVDFKALVKWVNSRSGNLELLLPNEKALNKMAEGMKDKMSVPGVRVVKEEVAGMRS